MIMIFLSCKFSPIKNVVGLNVIFIIVQRWNEKLKSMKNSKLLLNKVFKKKNQIHGVGENPLRARFLI
jgi:hypothetical protein